MCRGMHKMMCGYKIKAMHKGMCKMIFRYKIKAMRKGMRKMMFGYKIKATQALHGLAPKYKLINMHELINKSTNDYVTLLPCENGVNVNNKG